ncbi:MAG: hypothetical protein ACRDWN_04915, partial [Acidimicrobiales bacterium]
GIDPPVALPVDPPAAPLASLPVASAGRLVPSGSGDVAIRPPGGPASAVLDALGWEPCSLDEILRRTGLSLDRASAALEGLRADGQVHGAGGWWERA